MCLDIGQIPREVLQPWNSSNKGLCSWLNDLSTQVSQLDHTIHLESIGFWSMLFQERLGSTSQQPRNDVTCDNPLWIACMRSQCFLAHCTGSVFRDAILALQDLIPTGLGGCSNNDILINFALRWSLIWYDVLFLFNFASLGDVRELKQCFV